MSTTFSNLQYDMCYPSGIEHHWWTTARNRLLADILRRESCDTSAILEVGCGRGLVVKGLRDSGLNIRGVELADVQPLEGVHPFVDSGTDACDLTIEQRSEVRALLLLDVIEHLPDPEEFLKKLEGSFPSLTVVIVTVPTCQELWSNYDTYYGHYRRYTLEMLEKLSSELNWTTKDSGYFFRLPYIPMRLMSLLGVERSLTINPPGKVMRPMHSLVSSMSYLEQIVLPKRVRGTSAFAVYCPANEK